MRIKQSTTNVRYREERETAWRRRGRGETYFLLPILQHFHIINFYQQPPLTGYLQDMVTLQVSPERQLLVKVYTKLQKPCSHRLQAAQLIVTSTKAQRRRKVCQWPCKRSSSSLFLKRVPDRQSLRLRALGRYVPVGIKMKQSSPRRAALMASS